MILTNDELNSLRVSIEAMAGLETDLSQRCSHLIHIGAFYEAVQAGFVLLEEKLRSAADKDGLTGVQTANYAFGQNGPLTLLATQMGHTESRREGMRELFSGAFKLFRNPSAHGVVGYSSSEAKSIIGLINLMLRLLGHLTGSRTPVFPQNVEAALAKVQEKMGAGPTHRLHTFFVGCTKSSINPQPSAKSWLPFKRNVQIVSSGRWPKSKIYSVTMFYFSGTRTEIRFPLRPYKKVKGFNTDTLQKELKALGFQPVGKQQNYKFDLRNNNDQTFFDKLLELVLEKASELEHT